MSTHIPCRCFPLGRPPILRASPLCTWLRTFLKPNSRYSVAYGKLLHGGISIISISVHTKLHSSSPSLLVSISTPLSINYNTLLPLHSVLNWFIPLFIPHIQVKSGKSVLFQLCNVSVPHLYCCFKLWTARVACFPLSLQVQARLQIILP